MSSRSHRPKFEIKIQIHDIFNIPLVTGYIFVKWHIHGSSRAESRGKTDHAVIREHKAAWEDYVAKSEVKISVGKQEMLNELPLHFEVHQEMHGGRDRMQLGNLSLNLAEYVQSQEGETRRYLLQESKVNSTIRLTLWMKQISGYTAFKAPELRKVNMFHGITTLLADNAEAGGVTEEDSAKLQMSVDQHSNDVYKRTFTAQWRMQAGELTPFEVVEDIFRGGTGWKANRKYHGLHNTADHSSILKQIAQIHTPSSMRFEAQNTGGDDSGDDEEDQNQRNLKTSHLNATLKTSSLHPSLSQWEKDELEMGERSWTIHAK